MRQAGAGSERRGATMGMLILCVCFALVVLTMLLALAPERYSLQVGDIAPKTITATKDVIDEGV